MESERDRIRILLADGHHLVRQGIRQLLEQEADFEVIAEADDGLQAVKLAHELKPDIVIIEARLPKGQQASEAGDQVLSQRQEDCDEDENADTTNILIRRQPWHKEE